MADIATTRLSSKGQVVIAKEIRAKLKLKPGTRLVVVGEKDVVILKTIFAPEIDEFDRLIANTRKAARHAGLKKSDIDRVVSKARKNE